MLRTKQLGYVSVIQPPKIDELKASRENGWSNLSPRPMASRGHAKTGRQAICGIASLATRPGIAQGATVIRQCRGIVSEAGRWMDTSKVTSSCGWKCSGKAQASERVGRRDRPRQQAPLLRSAVQKTSWNLPLCAAESILLRSVFIPGHSRRRRSAPCRM